MQPVIISTLGRHLYDYYLDIYRNIVKRKSRNKKREQSFYLPDHWLETLLSDHSVCQLYDCNLLISSVKEKSIRLSIKDHRELSGLIMLKNIYSQYSNISRQISFEAKLLDDTCDVLHLLK